MARKTGRQRTPFRRSISKIYIKSVSFALLILCSHSVNLAPQGFSTFYFLVKFTFRVWALLVLCRCCPLAYYLFLLEVFLNSNRFPPSSPCFVGWNHTLLIFPLAALLCICFSLNISFSNSTDQNYNYSQLWLPAACAIESVSSFHCWNGHWQEVS